MKIYKYFAEDEKTRYTFLYTFKASKQEIIQHLKSIEGDDIIIFDIFPEIHFEKVVLEDILSVITESGKEMYIPAGLEVEYHTVSRILYSKED
tara:strand:- start:534 stop:812 length:279 start_codon:yes stop_codon:yes gene_type:complete